MWCVSVRWVWWVCADEGRRSVGLEGEEREAGGTRAGICPTPTRNTTMLCGEGGKGTEAKVFTRPVAHAALTATVCAALRQPPARGRSVGAPEEEPGDRNEPAGPSYTGNVHDSVLILGSHCRAHCERAASSPRSRQKLETDFLNKLISSTRWR